jgi:hypothetical protein
MTAKKLLTAKNPNEVLMKILSTLELIVKNKFWFCFCLFQGFLCFQGNVIKVFLCFQGNVSDFVFRVNEGCQCSQKSDGWPGKIGQAAKIRPILAVCVNEGWGSIFSRVWRYYEQAVSNLDP